ncbi:hypothetical protein D7322_07755 [Sphingobacterium puteale]|uniref:Uncharacterized protein n=1 Tax=Sphingobacterium puteale TaxID=2420510 RepID=A0A420W076_9SPHI|nr:hypothetical protein D7322_07755 [Sphingobacterium puteale]
MKKTIFQFWLVNILISITLSVLYRMVISDLNSADNTLFERFISILNILINLGLSTVYLVAIVFSSLSLFLNQIEKIRYNYFLSFLTFSGIPFICVLVLGAEVLIDYYRYDIVLPPLRLLLLFSIVYLICTFVEFLLFRKKVEKIYS